MDTHWENAREWDREEEEEEEEIGINNATSPGSFHCKSALRCHDSNMKLFLYRRSFLKMKATYGSIPYNEDVILLLPDLWNCFYHKTHGLDRIYDMNKCRAHSCGSPAFMRWANSTLDTVTEGGILEDIFKAEAHIWQSRPSWIDTFIYKIYPTVIDRLKRVLYLVYFINLSLLVLNYREHKNRPDINIRLPGIITEEDDNLYKISYNEYLNVYVCNECVRVVTPIFDQILQKDLYLNLSDKINERMNIILGSHIISYAACSYPNDCDNYDIHLNQSIHKIIQWGDDLLYTHKNSAYSLIGKFEAYCVSSIIKRDDPKIWKNDEFQQNLLQDDLNNQVEMYPAAQKLCQLLDSMHESVLAEVHGLWRIWGHPIIDLEGGLRKMENTCTKHHNISARETQIGTRTFKLTFAKNYYQKHHHYPLTNMTDQIMFDGYSDLLQERDREDYEVNKGMYQDGSYIHRSLRTNAIINEKSSDYTHSDWDQVIFLQSFQIPQSINLATMIKDKAISQTRRELIESVTLRNSVFDPKKRRGVLKWLSEQTLRLKNYLLRIDNEGLDENDRIIGLYPKERELKPKARFFSLMSYNMRMYITATEEILGRYFLPYFPMITMSDTLLSMIIRLFNMTTRIGASGSRVTYSMNIDFSKWNQNMREATNDGIFSTIDRIVGFRRLISRTHDIFRNSYLYLCSGEYIPSIIRGMLTTVSPYSRIGDESGKEGLRQKGWTITTVCDILSLAFLHGVKIELIGGGDNQVLTVEIYSQGKNLLLSEDEQLVKIQERMNRFRNALAKKMEKRGLPLKLEETWISHRLLMYNKIMYLSGVPLPGRLKVISRMFSNSNEGILTLGNITSTLGTGFQSLSAKDYDPLLAWVLSRVITQISLGQYYLANPVCGVRRLDQQVLRAKANIKKGSTHFGEKDEYWRPKKQSVIHATQEHSLSFIELYLVCLYFHKVLGGPGIGTPLSYIMKGFPDPVSEALAFNYSVISHMQNKRVKSIIQHLTAVNRSEVMHWEHLLEDPVSLNHDAPSHGVAALREQAEQILKKADIKNIKFKELISLGDTEYLRSLSEKLCSPAEIEPRLLHDIVGSTIPGYVNTILSKVDQSSTLSKLAVTTDVVNSVYTSEMEYYMYLANKVHVLSGHTPGECPTEDARALRNITWRRTIIGVTTPHPMAFLKHVEHETPSACDQNYISVIVKRSRSRYLNLRGEFRPYFGSYTQEKFKSSVLSSAYGDEDILKRSLKIQKLLGWRFKAGSTMYNIIQSIMRCVTDSDPNKFLPTPEEITGDVEHRYHDMATKHGGIPSNLIKYYTYASCNTTTFINHSKGAANESLHFQAAIIYSCMVSLLKTLNVMQTTRVFHFHETCKTCIRPIISSQNDGENLQDISLISCPANELMYIEEKDIPVHYHNHVAFLKSQEKRQIALPDNIVPVTFDTPKERSSWLILVCASFLSSGHSMKRSAVTLITLAMTAKECVFVVKNMAIVSALLEGHPWNKVDAAYCTDLYMKHRDILDVIFGSLQMVSYLCDLGVIPTDHIDYVGGFIMEIFRIDTSGLDEDISYGISKYQDPEYYPSRILISSKKNPSLKTCNTCVTNLKSKLRNHGDRICGIHGALITDVQFHMYSLDKLSRYKGPPAEFGNTGLVSSKRKRSSIFDYIRTAKDDDLSLVVKRRKSGFLFSIPDRTMDYDKILTTSWSSDHITIEGSDRADMLTEGQSVRPFLEIADGPPPLVSYVLNVASSIIKIISDFIRRNKPNTSASGAPISMSIETVSDGKSYIAIARAMVLVNNILISKINCKILLYMYCSGGESLEAVNIRYLEMVVEAYKRMTSSLVSNISFINVGDQCLDILSMTTGKDIVVAMSAGAIEYITSNYYLISDSSKIYSELTIIGADMKRKDHNHEMHLIQPYTIGSAIYPVIVFAEMRRTFHQISDALLLSAMSEHSTRKQHADCADIIYDISSIGGISVYKDLFNSLVTIKSGITSKSSYESIISKLAGGIYVFALQSSQSVQMPWRCIAIIKLIISIKILTDMDQTDALSYYSACHSVSFRKGTYKIITLHRGSQKRRKDDKLINWTEGTLGEKIGATIEDVRRWLLIGWRSNHPRLPYLAL